MNILIEKKKSIQKSLDSVYKSYNLTKKYKKDFLKYKKLQKSNKKMADQYRDYVNKNVTHKNWYNLNKTISKAEKKADNYQRLVNIYKKRRELSKDKISSTGFSKGLKTIAVITIIIGASYVIYKKYFTKAAKACSNKTGIDKNICIKNFRKQAIKLQINSLQSNINKCRRSKNPEKCKNKIQVKINKLKTKLG